MSVPRSTKSGKNFIEKNSIELTTSFMSVDSKPSKPVSVGLLYSQVVIAFLTPTLVLVLSTLTYSSTQSINDSSACLTH